MPGEKENIKREGREENLSDTNSCYSKATISIKKSHRRPLDLIQIPSEGGCPVWHDQVPLSSPNYWVILKLVWGSSSGPTSERPKAQDPSQGLSLSSATLTMNKLATTLHPCPFCGTLSVRTIKPRALEWEASWVSWFRVWRLRVTRGITFSWDNTVGIYTS